jgi:hypothetical protein
MFSPNFIIAYPGIARALAIMANSSQDDGEDSASSQQKDAELKSLLEDQTALKDALQGIRLNVGQSNTSLFQFCTNAYRRLGVSEDVRNFMGMVLSDVFQNSSNHEACSFLQSILGEQRLYFFELLDFSTQVFRDVNLPSSFVTSWIREARIILANDFHQSGFWSCLENYCHFQTVEALIVLKSSANSDDLQFRSTLARMLNWIREVSEKANMQTELAEVELLLRSQGAPVLRSIYFESWGYSVANDGMYEDRAMALKEDFFRHGSEQKSNWAFLIANAVMADRTSWRWAYREIDALCSESLDAQTLHWLRSASLAGWKTATSSDLIGKEAWGILFTKLPPLQLEAGEVWNQLEYVLIESLSNDFPSVQTFMTRLAMHSGDNWAKLLEKGQGQFSSLHSRLLNTGHAGTIITKFCLSPRRTVRRIGVKMFLECGIDFLEQDSVARATSAEVELLIHQAALQLGHDEGIAKLHACIASRVEEIGGQLEEIFYDEVSTQALNTHAYRSVMEKFCVTNSKMIKCVEDARQRISETMAAGNSPALQMTVSGIRRAESISMRRMSRFMQEGMEKNSLLLHLCKSVQLLYGKTWRMRNSDGDLSPKSDLQKSEVSSEIPRLEIFAPERMRSRRLMASARIDQLETERDNPE